jgi:hypothetical protein
MVALSMMFANHASTTITIYWPLGRANRYRKVETTKLLPNSALTQHRKQHSMLHVTLCMFWENTYISDFNKTRKQPKAEIYVSFLSLPLYLINILISFLL